MPIRRLTTLVFAAALVGGCGGSTTAATGDAPASAATTQPMSARSQLPAPTSLIYQGPTGLTLLVGGGAPRPFFSRGGQGSHPDWSPRAGRMVFVRDEADGTADIWVADRDGEQQRRVVDCREPCLYAENPSWSPDGRSIAYWTNASNDLTQDIRIVDVATGRVRTNISYPELQGPVNPRWSPDGRSLVVNVEQYAEQSGEFVRTGSAIGVIDLRGQRPRQRLITATSLQAWYPDWSPDGSRIVFTAGNLDAFADPGRAPNNLYSIRPDGSRLTQLTRLASGDPLIALPDWTSDGAGLLVTVIHNASTYAIGRISADGTGLTEFTDPTTGAPLQGAHPRDLGAVR